MLVWLGRSWSGCVHRLTTGHADSPHADLYTWPREVPCDSGPRASRGTRRDLPAHLDHWPDPLPVSYRHHDAAQRGPDLARVARLCRNSRAGCGGRLGGPVLITSRRGQVRTQAPGRPAGAAGHRVLCPSTGRRHPANLLTHDFALDPLAKIPEYKVCAVRLERPRSGAHGKTQRFAALRSTSQHFAALRSTSQHFAAPLVVDADSAGAEASRGSGRVRDATHLGSRSSSGSRRQVLCGTRLRALR